MIQVRTLGECVIEIDGVAVQPKSQQVFATLLFLILQAGHRITRQRLATTLWPDLDERRALTTLRQVVYSLRRLGIELHWDTLAVFVSSRDVELDITKEIARYSGGSLDPEGPIGAFLTGYIPNLSDAFSAWIDGERARRHTELLAALLDALNKNRLRGRWPAVDLLARRCLACDPLNEEATLAIAEAAAMTGRKVDALTVIDRYLRELPAHPSTLRLPAEHLRVRIADHLPQIRNPIDAVFVGRADDLAELNTIVKHARRGHGTAALLWGPPGIGKARTAQEVARLATLAGVHPVTTQRQASDSRRPLSLFTDLTPVLKSLPGALGCSQTTLHYLGRLTGEDPGQIAASPNPEDDTIPGYVLSAVRLAIADLIAAVSEEQPILFVIEQAHYLDPISAEVLSDLIANLDKHPIAIVLTAPTPFAPPHPLHAGTTNLIARELRPLTPAESERLLHDLIHNVRGGLDPATVAHYTTLADGNPYFLHELAISWMYHGENARVPATLTSALAYRVSTLSESAARVLQSATLLGPNSTFPRLERTTHFPRPALLQTIDELHRAGLLRPTPGPIQPRHEVVTSAALDTFTPMARQYLHHCIASVLEHDLESEPQLLWDCAAHLRDAEEFGHALTLVSSQAAQNLSLNLPREALDLWTHAETLCRTAEEFQRVSEGSIPALFALGEREQVHLAARDAMRIRDSLQVRETRVTDWQLDVMETSLYTTNRQTTELFEESFEILENRCNTIPHRIRAGTHALMIAGALFDRRRLTGVYDALQLLFRHRSAPADTIAMVEMIYRTEIGDLLGGVKAGRELVRLSRDTQPLATLAKRLRFLARPLKFLGEVEEARNALLEAREIAMQIDSHGNRLIAEQALAWSFLDRGDLEGFRHWLAQNPSCDDLPDSDTRKLTWSYLNAVAASLSGEIASAENYAGPFLNVWYTNAETLPLTRPQHMALTIKVLVADDDSNEEIIKCRHRLLASFRRLQSVGEQDVVAYVLCNPGATNQQRADSTAAVAHYISKTRLEKYPIPQFLNDRLSSCSV